MPRNGTKMSARDGNADIAEAVEFQRAPALLLTKRHALVALIGRMNGHRIAIGLLCREMAAIGQCFIIIKADGARRHKQCDARPRDEKRNVRKPYLMVTLMACK